MKSSAHQALGFIAAISIALSATGANAQAVSRGPVESRIEELVEMIHIEGDSEVRNGYAAQMAEYVASQRSEVTRLDAQVVDDIATLLTDSNDWVRFYGAASLGFVGPAARGAIPALEQALAQSRATMALNAGQPGIFGALSSAGAICTAFARIDLSRTPAGCENYR